MVKILIKNTLRSICPKIPKFDKISDFLGVWSTPKHKNFSKNFTQLFFHEMTQLEGIRLKTSKSRSNMDHHTLQHPPFHLLVKSQTRLKTCSLGLIFYVIWLESGGEAALSPPPPGCTTEDNFIAVSQCQFIHVPVHANKEKSTFGIYSCM